MKITMKQIPLCTLILSAHVFAHERYVVTEPDESGVAAVGDGVTDDTAAIRKALRRARLTDETVEVVLPAGTYYISDSLPLYSNTILTLEDGAEVISDETSISVGMLTARHLGADGEDCPMGESCTHGGYSQFSSVVIRGGTWTRRGSQTQSTFAFRLNHGQNICISNTVCRGFSNHAINLSASKDAKVIGVRVSDGVRMTSADPTFWGEYAPGDPLRYATIEAIHLDHADSYGEETLFPHDMTPCADVMVWRCVFTNTFSGVGTHHVYEKASPVSGLTVSDCKFYDLDSYGVYAYGMRDFSITDNVISGGGIAFVRDGTGKVERNVSLRAPKFGVMFDGNSRVMFNDNRIEEATDYGVRVEDSFITASSNVIVKGKAHGVNIDGGAYRSSGDRVSRSLGHNVRAGANTVLRLEGANIGACVQDCHGVYVSGAHASLIGTAIAAAGSAGIRVDDAGSVDATGCQITKSAKFGLYVSNGGSGELRNSRVQDSGSHGVYFRDSANSVLMANAVEGSGDSGLYCDGSDVVSQSNRYVRSGSHGINVVGGTARSRDDLIEESSGHGVRGENAELIISGALIGEAVKDSTHGLYAINAKVRARNCRIDGAGTASARISSKSDVELRSCELLAAGKFGVHADGGSVVLLRDCTIDRSGSHGVYLAGDAKSSLLHNVILGAGGSGIYLDQAPGTYLSGNVITEANAYGIMCKASDRSVLLSNSITGSARQGIFVQSSQDCQVFGNTVRQSLYDALLLEGVDGGETSAEVVGNVLAVSDLAAPTYYDLRCGKFTVNTTISGNLLQNHDYKQSKDGTSGIKYEESKALPDKCRVKFDGNGVSWSGEAMTCRVGEKFANLPKIDMGTEVFSGWALDADGNCPIGDEDVVPPVSQMTLYAQWNRGGVDSYWIGFNLRGGRGVAMADMRCRVDRVFSLPKASAERSGYRFAGWMGSNGKRYDDEMLVFNVEEPDGKLVLTAIWDAK